MDAAAFLAAIKADEQLFTLYNLGQSSAKLLMEKLDANGDGIVTRDELKAFLSDVQKTTMLKRPSKVDNSRRSNYEAATTEAK